MNTEREAGIISKTPKDQNKQFTVDDLIQLNDTLSRDPSRIEENVLPK